MKKVLYSLLLFAMLFMSSCSFSNNNLEEDIVPLKFNINIEINNYKKYEKTICLTLYCFAVVYECL